jgi:hypothetical protein
LPPLRRVSWNRATRIIATRYPPINLFERLSSDPALWDAMIAVEMLVNPRVRDAVGQIRLVSPDQRVSGPGASFVMAAFTHVNPLGSRFSDGSYGVYYAAREIETAIAETAFHFGRIALDSSDPPRYENFRVLVSRVDDRFHDVDQVSAERRTQLLDPDSYALSRAFGRQAREAGSRGLQYTSVRRPAGRCLAVLQPRSAGLPTIAGHLQYHWDGQRVRRYFDYGRGEWNDLA